MLGKIPKNSHFFLRGLPLFDRILSHNDIEGEHTHFWREKDGASQFDPEAGNLLVFSGFGI